MTIRLAAAILALLACSCASTPRAVYQLNCPLVEPTGNYSVFHMRDSRARIYHSDRWRCIERGTLTHDAIVGAMQ